MPSEKVLKQKQQKVEDIVVRLNRNISGVFVDYKGLTVAQDTDLRNRLRAAGVTYSVVKNTLTRFAAKKAGLEGLDDVLQGTTSLALHESDLIAPAKILAEFAKSSKDKEMIRIKAGFIEGKVVGVEDVMALAQLPSKEVLISKVLGGLNAPISGFANVLNANLRGLVTVLDAIAKKTA